MTFLLKIILNRKFNKMYGSKAVSETNKCKECKMSSRVDLEDNTLAQYNYK